MTEQVGVSVGCVQFPASPACTIEGPSQLTASIIGETLLAAGLIVACAAIAYRLWQRKSFDFEKNALILVGLLVLAAVTHAAVALTLRWPGLSLLGYSTIAMGIATLTMAVWMWLRSSERQVVDAHHLAEHNDAPGANQRHSLESEIREAKERLETVVCERTRSLMRANDSLEQHAAILSFALESARGGLFDWDAVTDKLTLDRHASAIVGLMGNENRIMLDDFADYLCDSSARSKFVRDLRRVDTSGNAAFAMSFRLKRPDGRMVWVQCRIGSRGNQTKPRAGTATGMFCDISERVQIEQAARSDRRTLIDVVESLAEPICVFDGHDQLILWNRHYADLFGDERYMQLEGATFESILQARLDRGTYGLVRDREAWLKQHLADFRGGSSRSIVRLANGSQVAFDRLRTANGNTVSICRGAGFDYQPEDRAISVAS